MRLNFVPESLAVLTRHVRGQYGSPFLLPKWYTLLSNTTDDLWRPVYHTSLFFALFQACATKYTRTALVGYYRDLPKRR